jgi:hypothetical protein
MNTLFGIELPLDESNAFKVAAFERGKWLLWARCGCCEASSSGLKHAHNKSNQSPLAQTSSVETARRAIVGSRHHA